MVPIDSPASRRWDDSGRIEAARPASRSSSSGRTIRKMVSVIRYMLVAGTRLLP